MACEDLAHKRSTDTASGVADRFQTSMSPVLTPGLTCGFA
jgi:hypothetical protein